MTLGSLPISPLRLLPVLTKVWRFHRDEVAHRVRMSHDFEAFESSLPLLLLRGGGGGGLRDVGRCASEASEP